MNNSRLSFLILLSIIAIATIILTVAIMAPLIALPTPYLILDGIVCGLLLTSLSFLLKEVIKYTNHNSLPITQQMINYGALAVLFVLCWVGINFLILNILLPEGTIYFFFPTIPIRILIALLVYALIVLLYRYILVQDQSEDIHTEIEVEDILNSESTEEIITTEKAPEDELLEHVAVKNGQKIDVIFISEIICIQAEGDYVMIFTSKGKYLKEQTMKYFADHLPKNKFVRVHRSNIINIDYIQRIELYEKQNQVLKLQNNLQVKMSLAGYKELKKVLNL